jgi:hypothetical protein
MGVSVIISEASIGDVVFKPTIKEVWLRAIPKNDAKNNIRKSFFESFSLLTNKDANQKTSVAPTTLK